VAGDDLLLAGGIKRASSTISIDNSGNIVLTGTSINAGGSVIHNVANPASAQDAATKNYVDGGAGGSVILANGTVAFTGNESMGGNKLTGLGAPTVGGDATNKTYVDAQDTAVAGAAAAAEALDLRLNGSRVMTGALDMGTHLIDNVVNPVSAQDAATKNYTDTQDTAVAAAASAAEALDLRLSGSRVMTGALDMGTHLIHNVVDPVVAQDAATKNYVDTTAGGGGVQLAFADINYTGGVEGFTAIADVTGVTVTFTLGVTGPVQFFASGASLANPFIQGNYLGLAINVNGTDYYGNGTGAQGFNAVGGGNVVVSGFTSGDAITMFRVLNLSPGFYTVKLRAFGNGYLESSSNFPTRLVAVYPTVTGTVATASPLTKQETGPFGPTTFNPAFADTYDPIPSSTTTVILSAPQTVMLLAYSTFVDTGSNSVNAQLGVRVTSPGPSVVDYDGSRISGGNDVNADVSMLSRAVVLGAGTHTIGLVAKSSGGGAYRYENAFLTVVYTVPQAVSPVPFSLYQTAVRTAGDDTTFAAAGTFNDVSGPVEVTINTVGGDVIVEVQGAGETVGGGGGTIGLGLKVDGVEQATSPGFTPMGNAGANANDGYVGYKYLVTGLSAGSHTFRLTKVRTGTSATYTVNATTGQPLRMFVWYN
jgi:hypothetical protein